MGATVSLVEVNIIVQRRHHMFHIVGVLAIVMVIIGWTIAQESHSSKRLTLAKGVGTVSARGEVGGESQDRYIVNLEAGRKVTVALYSEQNKAEFSICNEKDGFGDSDICEGSKSIRLRDFSKSKKVIYRRAMQWAGRIPAAGDYTISVVAYPGSARYVLRIKVE